MVQTRQKVSKIVPKCPKMPQNAHFKRIVVRTDLFLFVLLFYYHTGYASMCGHGVICLGRFAVDYGFVKNPTAPETVVDIQAPCGIIRAFVDYDGKRTGKVSVKASHNHMLSSENVNRKIDGGCCCCCCCCLPGGIYPGDRKPFSPVTHEMPLFPGPILGEQPFQERC